MRKRCSDILKYVLSLLIAAILLYFSFRGVKWADFYDGLRHCRWIWIAVAMAAGIITFWLRALRWQQLIAPIDPSIRTGAVFNAINIGYLANLALPRVGEFVRCGFITRHTEGGKASYDKVLGTVVLERSWDVLSMMILFVVMAVSMWGRYGDFLMEKVFLPFSGRFNANMWWITLVLFAVCAFVLWFVWRFRNKMTKVLYGFIKGLVQGVSSCLKMRHAWKFMLYTLLIWALYWLMSASVLWAVQGMDVSGLDPELAAAVSTLSELDLMDALFLMLVGSLSSLIPVPGGFGAFHYIVATALLSVYGIPFGIGIVFATLSHESQAVTMLLCGGVSYGLESMSFVRGDNN